METIFTEKEFILLEEAIMRLSQLSDKVLDKRNVSISKYIGKKVYKLLATKGNIDLGDCDITLRMVRKRIIEMVDCKNRVQHP